jgi:DNA ligase-1
MQTKKRPLSVWQAVARILTVALLALPCFAAAQLPPLMLAGRYQADVDPAGYWVSEKLDGVRALWNGRQLLFRSGRPVGAPAWFVAGLPQEPLDGELWIGRGRFEQLVGTVRTHEPDDAAWREVKYMIFDLPAHPGTFTERIAAMQRTVSAAQLPWVQVVGQHRVADREALRREFDRVVSAGGEGLMLHRANALRVAGRTDAILKYVPWLDDEARVIAHIEGKGKYAGMLGALLVETADGRRFRIGTGFTDAQRRTPPAPGTLLTYRYRELTAKGLPRFPSFLRLRELP